MDVKIVALTASLLLLAGCPSQPVATPFDTVAHATTDAERGWTTPVRTVHDAKHGVTCWYMAGGYGGSSPALSCLPDSQIKDPR